MIYATVVNTVVNVTVVNIVGLIFVFLDCVEGSKCILMG